MSSIGLAYDLRTCQNCGHLYDHEHADWTETKCANCHTEG